MREEAGGGRVMALCPRLRKADGRRRSEVKSKGARDLERGKPASLRGRAQVGFNSGCKSTSHARAYLNDDQLLL